MTAANASIAYRDAFFARFFFGKDSVASRFLITIDAIAAMRTRRLRAIIVTAAFVIWRVKLVAAIATIAWRDAFFYAFFSENDSVASRFFNYYRRNCGVAGVALTSNHFADNLVSFRLDFEVSTTILKRMFRNVMKSSRMR